MTYSDEQRRRSRETIERVDALQQHTQAEPIGETIAAFEPRNERIETRNERHIREIEERDAQWAAEGEADRARRERSERERANAAGAAVERRVADLETQFASLYDTMLELTRATDTYIDGLEHELSRRTSEAIELKATVAKLEKSFAELLADSGNVIDLPPSPRVVQSGRGAGSGK
jgi:hypothetical protein